MSVMTIAIVSLTGEERDHCNIQVPLFLWVDLVVLYLFMCNTNLFDITDSKLSCIVVVLAMFSLSVFFVVSAFALCTQNFEFLTPTPPNPCQDNNFVFYLRMLLFMLPSLASSFICCCYLHLFADVTLPREAHAIEDVCTIQCQTRPFFSPAEQNSRTALQRLRLLKKTSEMIICSCNLIFNDLVKVVEGKRNVKDI